MRDLTKTLNSNNEQQIEKSEVPFETLEKVEVELPQRHVPAMLNRRTSILINEKIHEDIELDSA